MPGANSRRAPARGERPMRILCLIRSWNRGGAERQCAQLVHALAARGHEVTAVSLYSGGAFSAELAGKGVHVQSLAKRGRFDVLGPWWRYVRLVRAERPDVIYSFMPAANLLTASARVATGTAAIVWGVRATRVDGRAYGLLSRMMYWMERMLIGFPRIVICNSEASCREIAALRSGGVEVVENGIDVGRFRPEPELRGALRREFGLDSGAMLIGIVGRLDPMKDHATFLEAAALIRSRIPGIRFLVAGADGSGLERRLRDQAEALGIGESVLWRAPGDDVEIVYNALDVLVSSSTWGEGFSNVIAEAMACGVPVVATDVGDARRIVGDAGRVVAARSPEALCGAVLELLRTSQVDAGAAARARIASMFGMERCVERTEALLQRAVAGR